jgi:hypothetical protein
VRLALTVAVAASLFAAASAAQPPPTPATSAKPPAASSDPTVSGVTVMPLPIRSCKPKDKDCIALVVAELKEHYPEQLKKFCFQTEMNVQRQDIQANVNGWCDDPRYSSSAICNHHVPPVLKQACAADPKPK